MCDTKAYSFDSVCVWKIFHSVMVVIAHAIFFPRFFFIFSSHFCSFMVVWKFVLGSRTWFWSGVFSIWGLRPMVLGSLRFLVGGALYVNIGE